MHEFEIDLQSVVLHRLGETLPFDWDVCAYKIEAIFSLVICMPYNLPHDGPWIHQKTPQYQLQSCCLIDAARLLRPLALIPEISFQWDSLGKYL